MKQTLLMLFCAAVFSFNVSAQVSTVANEAYLSWTTAQAENIGKAMREGGKAGSYMDGRFLKTDRSINYKLRATLMTPEVIRATARLEQLRNRLSDEKTRQLITEAEAAGDIVVMIEIDPNEGSGVIPLDWRVFLQPKGAKAGSPGVVAGIKSPHLRNVKALAGVSRRDYDYDVFWVVFPATDENNVALFGDNPSQLELLVGIYNKEGRVSWQIPESVRTKIKTRQQTNSTEKK